MTVKSSLFLPFMSRDLSSLSFFTGRHSVLLWVSYPVSKLFGILL
ncbi:hypothetical protein LEP1GSC050_2037 [Leptospira broomii serovar Hurstbridge str. 5399]|uniref:Uncharacterized protein n=3 Tax=Leptospira TaxID=171 RepID=V6HLJ0_9LEPT|nr:hypothetical protein LEP1GSC058_1721 [Leptospira fainei serovar Hurstbridge str. BUT 6]EQA37755.1 hypothetical protein LEP1GSC047_4055 [Leptospira inadai serovar Lyme str. 10]EQA45217.1 hypothetical protein LEP1GSC050_2037 [Leptospira broomii serovar Hurstbridge str. 5399]